MHIGFNLLLWTSRVTEQHFPVIAALAQAGYDGVEVPILAGPASRYAAVRRVVQDNGLACSVVTNMPDAECNPISADRAQRGRALDFMKMVIDCTHTMGATLLCGPFYQPVGLFTGTGPTHEEQGRAAEHARASAEYAVQAGITLAVEFLNRFEAYFLTTMDGAAEHVGAVGMPNFRAMFDTFHANIEEADPVASIRRHRGIITHVHVAENDRGVPGRGHNDWEGIFRALQDTGYDGWLTVEAFGRVLPAFAAATRIWRDIFESPEALFSDAIGFVRRQWDAAGAAGGSSLKGAR